MSLRTDRRVFSALSATEIEQGKQELVQLERWSESRHWRTNLGVVALVQFVCVGFGAWSGELYAWSVAGSLLGAAVLMAAALSAAHRVRAKTRLRRFCLALEFSKLEKKAPHQRGLKNTHGFGTSECARPEHDHQRAQGNSLGSL
jgi:hypothetical protein